MLDAVAELGRQYFGQVRPKQTGITALDLCHDLMSAPGEASGTALAREIVFLYLQMDREQKLAFLRKVSQTFSLDVDKVAIDAADFAKKRSPEALEALMQGIEPPRQELFRRINMAPGGTSAIVGMRALMLEAGKDDADLKALAGDLKHLLSSWFNRGFLQFEQIDWNSPASILEKLIDYEAVHEIQGWGDLRRRLAKDRRCYAFIHPALPEEPLIFVEVALTKDVAEKIEPLLAAPVNPAAEKTANTAVFYSISNCQAGLAGISSSSNFWAFLSSSRRCRAAVRALPRFLMLTLLAWSWSRRGAASTPSRDPSSASISTYWKQVLSRGQVLLSSIATFI